MMMLRTRGLGLTAIKCAGNVRTGPRQSWSKWNTNAMRFTTVEAGQSADKMRVVYHGGFDKVLRMLKRVSIFSCVCTVIGVPLLAFTSNNPRIQGVQKWAVAFVVVSFGVGTTVALHTMAKPYVSRLLLDATGEKLTIETMNMIGKLKTHHMEFKDVTRATKPWATFQSNRDPSKLFFVEEVTESYQDKAFMYRLFEKIGRPLAKPK